MNIQIKRLVYTWLIALALLFGPILLTTQASAAGTLTASFTDSGPMIEGQQVDVLGTMYDDIWRMRIDASTPPATSYVSITATASGKCGIWQSQMGPWGSYSSSGSTDINKGQSYNSAVGIAAYPINDSVDSGTTTCTVSFSVSSTDPEYSSATIDPISITISDDDTPVVTESDPDPAPQSTPSPSASSQPSEEAKKPDVPTTKLVDPEGNELKPQEGEDKITFQDNQPIVLSGTTVPNGEVKLYIFSDPQEATVTANENGVWNYTIENIEPGDHRVEIEVTDPETGETSERQQVLAFAVSQADDAVEEEEAPLVDLVAEESSGSSGSFSVLLGIATFVVGVGGGVFWWMRRKKQSSALMASKETMTSAPHTQTDTDKSTEQG